ncbi:Uncharacterised protein [uncultured archaeon]|nr:Uncharacterised protein [uncultured archaeon]
MSGSTVTKSTKQKLSPAEKAAKEIIAILDWASDAPSEFEFEFLANQVFKLSGGDEEEQNDIVITIRSDYDLSKIIKLQQAFKPLFSNSTWLENNHGEFLKEIFSYCVEDSDSTPQTANKPNSFTQQASNILPDAPCNEQIAQHYKWGLPAFIEAVDKLLTKKHDDSLFQLKKDAEYLKFLADKYLQAIDKNSKQEGSLLEELTNVVTSQRHIENLAVVKTKNREIFAHINTIHKLRIDSHTPPVRSWKHPREPKVTTLQVAASVAHRRQKPEPIKTKNLSTTPRRDVPALPSSRRPSTSNLKAQQPKTPPYKANASNRPGEWFRKQHWLVKGLMWITLLPMIALVIAETFAVTEDKKVKRLYDIEKRKDIASKKESIEEQTLDAFNSALKSSHPVKIAQHLHVSTERDNLTKAPTPPTSPTHKLRTTAVAIKERVESGEEAAAVALNAQAELEKARSDNAVKAKPARVLKVDLPIESVRINSTNNEPLPKIDKYYKDKQPLDGINEHENNAEVYQKMLLPFVK